jgi:hypothetical protein
MFFFARKSKLDLVVHELCTIYNTMHKTDSFSSTNYKRVFDELITLDYCHSHTGSVFVTFLSTSRRGFVYLATFDVMHLAYFKKYFNLILKYNKINVQSLADYSDGSINGFKFIVKIYYLHRPYIDEKYIEYTIKTNNDFEIKHMEKNAVTITRIRKNSLKIVDLLSFEEEMMLVILKFQANNSEINQLLPEINTPSAYNFCSDEFQQRLLIASMIEC